MSSSSPSDPQSQPQTEVHTYKALPRDPNQAEHKKPRVFIHRPDEPEADPNAPPARVIDAAKSIQLEDFTKVHKTPCVRDAMLPGIGGGMAVGAARFVLGGSIMAACNWASGSFVGVSVIMYNYCQRRRKLEKEGIRRAVEVLDKKQALKEMQEKALEMGEKGKVGAGAATAATAGTAGLPPSSSAALPTRTGAGPSGGGNPNQNVSFWSSFKFW